MNFFDKYNQELERSLRELSDSIVHNPDDANLYYQRGFIYYKLNKNQSAETDYLKAVSLGLDSTKMPYYSFVQVYEYTTRDRIILFLFGVVFFVILGLEILRFISMSHN